VEPTDKEIQDQIRATLAKLSVAKEIYRCKIPQEKRQAVSDAEVERLQQEQEQSKTLKVTEFISANDLASLMNVSVNEVISTCMGLGMFVSINQRLDAEAITVIADELVLKYSLPPPRKRNGGRRGAGSRRKFETACSDRDHHGSRGPWKDFLLDYIVKQKL